MGKGPGDTGTREKEQGNEGTRGAIKKNLPNFGHRPNIGGDQQRSQTFYRKNVRTSFKGGGGSKGLVQSSFLQKSMYFRSMNSFFLFN